MFSLLLFKEEYNKKNVLKRTEQQKALEYKIKSNWKLNNTPRNS